MKLNRFILAIVLLIPSLSQAQKSGNPLFQGWYADPEAVIFGKTYWIYPTYSAKYKEQVFMDAFSSKDLITWKKHERIIDTSSIKWANKAMWAPSITKKRRQILFVLRRKRYTK